jgi:hypothetical protein
MRTYVLGSILLGVLALGPAPGEAQPMPSTTPGWVERLADRYFDPRSEATLFSARMEDHDGLVYVLTSVAATLDRLVDSRAPEELAFATRYRPIWQQDTLLRAEWDRRATRIPMISKEVLQMWQSTLSTVHGSEVGALWTLGILLDVDPLFTSNGFDDARAATVLRRIQQVPRAAIDSLSQLLNIGPGWAVALVIQNEDLFDDETFDQEAFRTAITNLRARIRMGRSGLQRLSDALSALPAALLRGTLRKTVQALRPGQGTISLIYVRPWEKTAPPDTTRFRVVVQ